MVSEIEDDNLKKILDGQEKTRQEYLKHSDPLIELPELPESVKQEIMVLFGEPDPEPPTPAQMADEYFNRPEDPEVIRQRREVGKYWHDRYQEGLRKGYYRT